MSTCWRRWSTLLKLHDTHFSAIAPLFMQSQRENEAVNSLKGVEYAIRLSQIPLAVRNMSRDFAIGLYRIGSADLGGRQNNEDDMGAGLARWGRWARSRSGLTCAGARGGEEQENRE